MVRTSGAGLTATDEKVKKSCSSHSLMKMQASQFSGAQMKDMQKKSLGAKKSNEGLHGSTANIMGKQPGRRVVEAHKKNASSYFASFNGPKGKTPSQQDKHAKLEQEKVTPPSDANMISSTPKEGSSGHHRRVQSHGQAMVKIIETAVPEDTATQVPT